MSQNSRRQIVVNVSLLRRAFSELPARELARLISMLAKLLVIKA